MYVCQALPIPNFLYSDMLMLTFTSQIFDTTKSNDFTWEIMFLMTSDHSIFYQQHKKSFFKLRNWENEQSFIKNWKRWWKESYYRTFCSKIPHMQQPALVVSFLWPLGYPHPTWSPFGSLNLSRRTIYGKNSIKKFQKE